MKNNNFSINDHSKRGIMEEEISTKGRRRKLKRIVQKKPKINLNSSGSVAYYKKVKAALNASCKNIVFLFIDYLFYLPIVLLLQLNALLRFIMFMIKFTD